MINSCLIDILQFQSQILFSYILAGYKMYHYFYNSTSGTGDTMIDSNRQNTMDSL
jgi:hypothetical protein